MAEYVVVDKEKLESDLTSVADSIRAKANVTEKLEFPSEYKSVVESIDTSKPEQEKTISITESGTTEVTPDEGKVLSKVTVNVEVDSGGGSEEFVGIKHSDFVSGYNIPRVADARSIIGDDDNFDNFFSNMFANATDKGNGGYYAELKEVYLPELTTLSTRIFYNCTKLENIYVDFTKIKTIGTESFSNCKMIKELPYMPSLISLDNNSFQNCTGLEEIKLYIKVNGISTYSFRGCTNIKDIYVPWSEGEVANAPWGATNATIHYNTTYDENHNPIV